MARMQGKVAIVTGAAGGIGAVFARSLAAEGAKVVIADIAPGEAVVREIAAAGGEAIFVATDVTAAAAVGALAQAAETRFGRIDVLVNNAAMMASLQHRSFLEIDSAEWDRLMAVNVRGPFECAKAVVPAMRRQGHGKIVNMSSGTFFRAPPNMLHYVTSKGAIIGMTRALARELGPFNIMVNAIAPGLTISDGVRANPAYTRQRLDIQRDARALKRDETPADLVGALLFLASADSDFVTGETIVVDGGGIIH